MTWDQSMVQYLFLFYVCYHFHYSGQRYRILVMIERLSAIAQVNKSPTS